MQPSDAQLETRVEDLVSEFPLAARYLLQAHGPRVICCGEPVWATVGDVARPRGLVPERVVDGLRACLAGVGQAPVT